MHVQKNIEAASPYTRDDLSNAVEYIATLESCAGQELAHDYANRTRNADFDKLKNGWGSVKRIISWLDAKAAERESRR